MGAHHFDLSGAIVPADILRQFPLPVAAVVPAARRPAIPVYAIDRPNRCPDCHGEAFFVGRVTAECGGCGMPLPVVSLRRLS